MNRSESLNESGSSSMICLTSCSRTAPCALTAMISSAIAYRKHCNGMWHGPAHRDVSNQSSEALARLADADYTLRLPLRRAQRSGCALQPADDESCTARTKLRRVIESSRMLWFFTSSNV